MHTRFVGTYLGIKYKDWQNYSISDQQTDPSHNDFAIKILFLLGQTLSNETQAKINTESEVYGDVIQESFLDTYNNLTLKTVMMLKWVNKNCQNKSKLKHRPVERYGMFEMNIHWIDQNFQLNS